VELADELNLVMAGPNGQGVVSPPASLCAQIVAPYPPRGRIGVASQSGNFVDAKQNVMKIPNDEIRRQALTDIANLAIAADKPAMAEVFARRAVEQAMAAIPVGS
jgi:hypothetical protein